MSKFTHAESLTEAKAFFEATYCFDTVCESKRWNDMQFWPHQQKLYVQYPDGTIDCLGRF